jgi:hypothetical protein
MSEEKQNKPDWFRRFGIWCSGASTEALYQCTTEWNKFAINGYVILMTAVLSFVSGSYFLSFVFPESNWKAPIAFGVIWAFLIFTLDRAIVVSIKKTGKFSNEFWQAFPRFILAIFIGVVIATPIELRLFEPEIKAKIADDNLKRQEELIMRGLHIDSIARHNIEQQIIGLRKQYNLAALESAEKEKYQKYDELDKQRIQEAEGTGGTKKQGKGPVYKEKMESFNIAKKEWETARDALQKATDEYNAAVSKIPPISPTSIPDEQKKETDGVEARVKTLYRLSELHWFLTLLFILIECLPVITKLMNKRGPYDATLERIEYAKMIEQKEIISLLNSEINEKLTRAEEAAKLAGETMIKSKKAKLDTELATNEAILKTIAEYQQEIALKALEKWREEELAKIKVEITGID